MSNGQQPDDQVILLDTIRIERNKPRKCTCGDKRRYQVDTANREITCGCGLIVDPYEAMEHIARNYERYNEDQKRMDQQRKMWVTEKPHSVIFKRLERDYQRGKMLPRCPSCGDTFDFKDITSWVNAEFFRKMKQREALRHD